MAIKRISKGFYRSGFRGWFRGAVYVLPPQPGYVTATTLQPNATTMVLEPFVSSLESFPFLTTLISQPNVTSTTGQPQVTAIITFTE